MKNLLLLTLLLISYSSFSQANKTAKWYSPDSSEYHIATTQKINGCDKITSEKIYSKEGMLLTTWEKKYATDKDQTCDFSAYIKTVKTYKNNFVIKEVQYVSGCDDCTETPCGTWRSYNDTGKLIETKQLGVCNTAQFKKL